MHAVEHRIRRKHHVRSARNAQLIQEILNILIKNILGPAAGIPKGRTFNNQRTGVVDPGPVLIEKGRIFDKPNFGWRPGRESWEIAIEERRSAQNELRTALLNDAAIHFEAPRG